jgi:hypothetical protein
MGAIRLLEPTSVTVRFVRGAVVRNPAIVDAILRDGTRCVPISDSPDGSKTPRSPGTRQSAQDAR